MRRSVMLIRSALAVPLLAVLVACSGGTTVTQGSGAGGGSPTSTTGASATGSAASGPENRACQLLTQDLVEQALGETMDPPISQAGAPLRVSSCSYLNPAKTAGATLVVTLPPQGATYYQAQKAAAQDPQNDTGFFREISGLGDDAFTDGLSVYVLSGGSTFGLVAFRENQHAGDTSTAEALLATILQRA